MSAEDDGPEQELAPYRLERARSSRSRCRACRRKIDKGALRLGILLEGPYGPGYLWHHLRCAARRRFEDVEEAYAQRAWDEDPEVPPLEELRALREKAAKEKAQRRETPYAERAKSARSKCKHCGEPIEKGAWRVLLLREVRFGRQARATPVHVHPGCVSAELRAEDCLTEADDLPERLRANAGELSEAEVEEVLAAIGGL